MSCILICTRNIKAQGATISCIKLIPRDCTRFVDLSIGMTNKAVFVYESRAFNTYQQKKPQVSLSLSCGLSRNAAKGSGPSAAGFCKCKSMAASPPSFLICHRL